MHMSHFLQSVHWERFQTLLGRTSVYDEDDGWSYRAYLEKGRLNTRLYAPRGPLLASPAALLPALDSLREAARKHGATLVRIEPPENADETDLTSAGLLRSARVQPVVTSIVDLSGTEDEIIARMKPTNRNLHRTFDHKGLVLHTSRDPASITILTSLLHGVAATTGMIAHSDKYLRMQAECFMPEGVATLYYVTYDNSPIVAALVYDYDGTRYYGHAAADYEHRKLGAGTAIVSHMMLEAKKQGLTTFDLYGIWPEAAPGSSHAGITAFKRSFGGRDVVYPGTWELPIRQLPYLAYQIARRFVKERT